MNNTSKFIVEIVITIIIAALVSGVIGILLAFVAGNIGTYADASSWINFVVGAVFGLIVGYKLNSLIKSRKA